MLRKKVIIYNNTLELNASTNSFYLCFTEKPDNIVIQRVGDNAESKKRRGPDNSSLFSDFTRF